MTEYNLLYILLIIFVAIAIVYLVRRI